MYETTELRPCPFCGGEAELLTAGEEVHCALVDLLGAYADIQRHYGLKPEASPIYSAAREANRKLVAAIAKIKAA